MRFERIVDGASAATLRADWLAAELEPVSDYGRRCFEALEPFAPGAEAAAAAHAASIMGFARALDPSRIDAIRDALRSVPDATGAIARAGMDDVLTDVNFLEVQRFCDVLARLEGLVGEHAVHKVPRCDAVTAALERGRAGKFGFYLDDRFDAALASARADLRRIQAEFDDARGSVAARVAATLGRQEVGTDEFIIMREELHGPLPAGVHVVREAPTYFLCELDLDDAALAALDRRDEQAERVAEMEEAVRAALSEVVREHDAELEEATRALGELDVLVAAARFVQRHHCEIASYTQAPCVEFEDAHFLPLQSELERQDRTYIPITLELSGTAVLTGPNMGGKSVALQTCGFVALCAAFGLPVPARRASIALFRQIVWLGIGVHGEVGGLLSSFAREVVRLRDTLNAKVEPALLLIDEFARTTTPHEGRALLLALIARLRERHICSFIATHLSGIATAAEIPHFAVRGLRGIPAEPPSENLQEALASLARSMDYTIEQVTDDSEHSADAIFLAGLLGMDQAFVKTAWQMLGRGETPTP